MRDGAMTECKLCDCYYRIVEFDDPTVHQCNKKGTVGMQTAEKCMTCNCYYRITEFHNPKVHGCMKQIIEVDVDGRSRIESS